MAAEVAPDGGGQKMSFSHALLRAELAELELRLVDRLRDSLSSKADVSDVHALESISQQMSARLTSLEDYRTQNAHLIPEFLDVKTSVDGLKSWQARFVPVGTVLTLMILVNAAGLWIRPLLP